jgi:hypothetical protein
VSDAAAPILHEDEEEEAAGQLAFLQGPGASSIGKFGGRLSAAEVLLGLLENEGYFSKRGLLKEYVYIL